MNLERLKTIHNGDKVHPTFSVQEMERRVTALRKEMAETGVDAVLFTSYHNINYYSDFLFTSFGRNYALVVTAGRPTPPSPRTSTPANPGGAASVTTSSTPTGSGTTTNTPSRPCWPTPASDRAGSGSRTTTSPDCCGPRSPALPGPGTRRHLPDRRCGSG